MLSVSCITFFCFSTTSLVLLHTSVHYTEPRNSKRPRIPFGELGCMGYGSSWWEFGTFSVTLHAHSADCPAIDKLYVTKCTWHTGFVSAWTKYTMLITLRHHILSDKLLISNWTKRRSFVSHPAWLSDSTSWRRQSSFSVYLECNSAKIYRQTASATTDRMNFAHLAILSHILNYFFDITTAANNAKRVDFARAQSLKALTITFWLA